MSAATRGRRYLVQIEITYVGGALLDDDRDALAAAVHAAVSDDERDVTLRVSRDNYDVLVLRAVVREASPAKAIGRFDASLDRSLLATGLFEAFDVTGKVLRAAPLELAERLRSPER